MRRQKIVHHLKMKILSAPLIIETSGQLVVRYKSIQLADLPSISSTIMAIRPPTSPTTCIAGFSFAANWGSTTPENLRKYWLQLKIEPRMILQYYLNVFSILFLKSLLTYCCYAPLFKLFNRWGRGTSICVIVFILNLRIKYLKYLILAMFDDM